MRNGEGRQCTPGLRMCGCLQQHTSGTSKHGTNISTLRRMSGGAANVEQGCTGLSAEAHCR
jgi:hypothetical protein